MIIAGTGHRPPVLFPDNPYLSENRSKLINFAVDELKLIELKYDKIDTVISGMAQGWDNAIAWAALILNIPLHSAVPFEGMDAKWPKESRDDFQEILNKANKITIVCDGGYANYKFYERDKFMVDNCDNLVALYNGNETGGTAITVKYAKKVNKHIINCWENWTKYRE